VNVIPTLTAAQWEVILVEWNQTTLEFDRTLCIHQLIEEQVERSPEHVAIVWRDKSFTYRQLDDRAKRLAQVLETTGVGPESVVGICTERSADLVVALLAVLKAGGAYLPLDPAFPAERIDFMLSDSEATTVLTQASRAHRFIGQTYRVVPVDAAGDEPSVSPASRAPNPANLAYLIYTSGSTGTPKGVMVEHRNVVNFFAAMDQLLGIEPGVWLAATSSSFDISVLELLWTLSRGFTVVIQDDQNRFLSTDNYSLQQQLRRHRVTHFQCTPTMAKILLASTVALAMKDLRVMLVGGEALLPPLAHQLRSTLNADIYNMYGPTETTVWSTVYHLKGDENSVPIGRPIANTQVYILNESLEPVPVGVTGELYIGGSGVARGYWRRPDLTAERFLPDRFTLTPGSRLYKTGDLVRYRPDGMIEFVGRADYQVKIRGFRVELNEIETVLCAHPGVQDAAVKLTGVDLDDPQLTGYVVRAPRFDISQKELRIYLRLKLPDYMVPSTVLFLDALPTTPNGKVDRGALTSLSLVRPDLIQPNGTKVPLEATIAQIWQDVLGLDAVGAHDNFFDLGANSLMVAEAAINLGSALGRPVKLIQFFTYPTVSSLARHLRGEGDSTMLLGSAATNAAARRDSHLRRAHLGRKSNG
jgi:amino acid adenylation domain-containing protein